MKSRPQEGTRLRRARLALGLSGKELAECAGIAPSRLSALELGKIEPRRVEDGKWKVDARAVSTFVGVSCEELWPWDAERRRFYAIHLEGERRDFVAVDACLFDNRELKKVLRRKVESVLPGVEAKVLISRLRGDRFDEIAAELGCRKERVRQLEARALRRLRTDGAEDLVPFQETAAGPTVAALLSTQARSDPANIRIATALGARHASQRVTLSSDPASTSIPSGPEARKPLSKQELWTAFGALALGVAMSFAAEK